jgi:hypothetical protein
MNYWKGLAKFLGKIIGGLVVVLGFFEWGVKLKVSTWVIPDWILLLLLALALSIAGYTAYFVSRTAKPGTVEKPKKPEIKLEEDEAIIIRLLAIHEDCVAPREALREKFFENVKGKNIAYFNIILNKLRRLGLIDFFHHYGGLEQVGITQFGLEFCEIFRKK